MATFFFPVQTLQEYECYASTHGHPKTDHEKREGEKMTPFTVTKYVKAKETEQKKKGGKGGGGESVR